jgi:hypothetical protein
MCKKEMAGARVIKLMVVITFDAFYEIVWQRNVGKDIGKHAKCVRLETERICP